MTYAQCISACIRINCVGYCYHLYNGAQRTLPGGVREWQFDVSHPELHLSERQPHPVGAEQIQTTAPDIDLRDEDASKACLSW
ncbi:uncharacterized protein STAUR_7605 [Stigmatella aurantiaca DW4/3-1]|uniref:Uncharacterized protein n=2 Tax=Stigmatella aurantiaca TaxID=41 RepID=E3FIL3_STIAD|nr:uncharacterized protein STAUR_7605 [Stigmatella aurantiaca DW4/3-1]